MKLPEQERRKFVADLNRICNDRARLEHGLRTVLDALGVGKKQLDKIIVDVRAANFDGLNKCIKCGGKQRDHNNGS